MNFIDMHIHLQDYKSTYAKNIVSQALRAGVKKMVCASIIEDDWEKVSVYASIYPEVVIPAFGLHPWYIEGRKEGWKERIFDIFQNNPKALVGETGVDGLTNTPIELQKKVFDEHILLAKKFERPIVIHFVKSGGVFDEYWDKLPKKFMIHSYNSSYEQLYHINRLGGYVSFSKSILKNKDREKILTSVPVNKILVETDGPYQSGQKGVESKPEDLPFLLKHIATIRGVGEDVLAKQIYENSEEFIK